MNFLAGLTLAFIILKLMHYIDWSWWLVISPLLIPISLGIIFTILTYFGVKKSKKRFF
jgi:ABC-type antimicrobial peptide transport system permease subunit